MSKKGKICVMLTAGLLGLSLLLGLVQCHREKDGAEEAAATTAEEPAIPPLPNGGRTEHDTSPVTVPGLDVEELTRNPNAQIEGESLENGRKPVVDLPDGKEIYLDPAVILLLSEAEKKGEEDAVNAVLDWILRLVDHFSELYEDEEAIRQVQRFFYLYRDLLMEEAFESVASRIGECIPNTGAVREGFEALVQEVFGKAFTRNADFVFDAEVPA